jgi:DNA-binding CsgD family transcriptional regulator
MTTEDDQISLTTLVGFLELPGAKRVLMAYARIPPGPIRQTQVDSIEAIAQAYEGLPPPEDVSDPLPRLLTPARPVAIPHRSKAEPPTRDLHTIAVKMRIEGKTTLEIVAETGLNPHSVYSAVATARSAGVTFPKIKRQPPGTIMAKRPTNFAMRVEDISELGLPRIQTAAERRGLTLAAYVDLRRQAVEMAIRGDDLGAILKAVGQDRQTLSNWFTRARQAGFPVPYVGTTYAPETEPEPKPQNIVRLAKAVSNHHGKTFCTTLDEYNSDGKIRAAVDKGARMANLTVAEFLRARRDMITLFGQGLTASAIAERTGMTQKQVENARTRARVAGKMPTPEKEAVRLPK